MNEWDDGMGCGFAGSLLMLLCLCRVVLVVCARAPLLLVVDLFDGMYVSCLFRRGANI